jgi:hypothetical protein
VLLEVLLGGGDHLQGNELVAALLESLNDIADEATLLLLAMLSAWWEQTYLDAIRLDGNEAGCFLAEFCHWEDETHVCSVDMVAVLFE